MCSPLEVLRGARDVKPANDNDPIAYQVKRVCLYLSKKLFDLTVAYREGSLVHLVDNIAAG
jgi:hypothetical protein